MATTHNTAVRNGNVYLGALHIGIVSRDPNGWTALTRSGKTTVTQAAPTRRDAVAALVARIGA